MTAAPASHAPSCARHLVDALLAHGIDTLYCVPGVQNDHLFDALYDVQDRMRIIHTRHEQGAAYMALGAAMATGQPAAYCVVPGPGVLNTTAALSTAYALNAPVLALTGQIPQRHIGRGYGMLHELPDQLGLLRSLTQWADRIRAPHEAGPMVQEAFRHLRSNRPRPVALECAIDVWGRRGEAPPAPPLELTSPALDPAVLDKAAQRLLEARCPLIIVGGGAQEAAPWVGPLAEALGAPVMSARMGRGVLDARHPLAITPPIGHRLWPQVDLVLAIGTRLQTQHMVWGMDAGVRVIRIDIDPEEIERHAPPELALCARAADAVPALLARVRALAADPPERIALHEQIAAHRRWLDGQIAQLQPQRDYLRAMRAALPEDGIFVEDMTQMGYTARFAYPVYRPRTYLSTGYQGTLGWGYATALGAKVARPEAAVVSVSGDGGFLFNVQELATAVQHRIGVVALVFDDGAFGNVRRLQQVQFPGRNIADTLVNPDFVRLAQSFGLPAWRAEDPQALRRCLDEALAHDGPTLIHVPVGEMPDPWKLLNMTRVRGA
ncbi:thiamine pyrophosphate-dependent enzyme [Ramlibacter rhizophilus]|uniref:TPP-binding protein n=1 Tax=Ramlibacter rhizophilus TaxID=1781167 RepID=A0A4Z0BPD0_9BURK|nr:thiamine pyrophosphate-dependent enzyme [Ramlibacter rhizophilus]TFY99818.1 TPP-binding protein [Ramlibacter rhizophilus]